MLTDKQLRFVELDKKKAEMKVFAEQYSLAVSELVAEMGLEKAFQDVDGTVYQTSTCEGKFVYFDKFEVKRTRREGERAGSLSMKAAKELGFQIKE